MVDELQEYRCGCGKLLFKAALRDGIIEIKCRNCHKILRFRGQAKKLHLAT